MLSYTSTEDSEQNKCVTGVSERTSNQISESCVNHISCSPLKPNVWASCSDILRIHQAAEGNISTFKPGEAMPTHSHPSVSSWNPTTAHVVACGHKDGVVACWDVKNHRPSLIFSRDKMPSWNARDVVGLAWSVQNPLHLVVAGEDSHGGQPLIQTWDLRKPSEPIGLFGNHTAPIVGFQSVPNTAFVWSFDRRGSVFLWNINDFSIGIDASSIYSKDISISEIECAKICVDAADTTYLAIQSKDIGKSKDHYTGSTLLCRLPSTIKSSQSLAPLFDAKNQLNLLDTLKFSPSLNNIQFDNSHVDLSDPNRPSIKRISRSLQSRDIFEATNLLIKANDWTSLLTSKLNNTKGSPAQNNRKSMTQPSVKDRQLFWEILSILKEKDFDKRTKILQYLLGTRESQLLREVSRITGKNIDIPSEEDLLKTVNSVKQVNEAKQVEIPEIKKEDAEDFFDQLAVDDEKEEILNREGLDRKNSQDKQDFDTQGIMRQHTVSRNSDWQRGIEMLVKDSMLTGNIGYAVELCLEAGRPAEAILIASSPFAPDGMIAKVTEELRRSHQEPWFKNMSEYMFADKNTDESAFDCFIENQTNSDSSLWKEILIMNISRLRSFHMRNEIMVAPSSKIAGDANAMTKILQLGNQLLRRDMQWPAQVCFAISGNTTKIVEHLTSPDKIASLDLDQLQDTVTDAITIDFNAELRLGNSLYSDAVKKLCSDLTPFFPSSELLALQQVGGVVLDDHWSTQRINLLQNASMAPKYKSIKLQLISVVQKPTTDVNKMQNIANRGQQNMGQSNTQQRTTTNQKKQPTNTTPNPFQNNTTATFSQPHMMPPSPVKTLLNNPNTQHINQPYNSNVSHTPQQNTNMVPNQSGGMSPGMVNNTAQYQGQFNPQQMQQGMGGGPTGGQPGYNQMGGMRPSTQGGTPMTVQQTPYNQQYNNPTTQPTTFASTEQSVMKRDSKKPPEAVTVKRETFTPGGGMGQMTMGGQVQGLGGSQQQFGSVPNYNAINTQKQPQVPTNEGALNLQQATTHKFGSAFGPDKSMPTVDQSKYKCTLEEVPSETKDLATQFWNLYLNLPEPNIKKKNDLEDRLQNLQGLMKENELSPNMIASLQNLLETSRSRNIAECEKISKKLAGIEFNKNKYWLPAIKRFITGK